ncbi:MAG: hypothetical protein L0Y54_19415 [Sporichthyaceae bacterium]|nr:hypothetical protein [Sporichthyaceae bacterium]
MPECVAKHAGAHRVGVSAVAGDQMVLTVTDDGAGTSSGGRRSGLRNLDQRATALGGSMQIEPREGGGTRLIWQVPLAGR